MTEYFIATIARNTSFAFEMRFAANNIVDAINQARSWVDMTNEKFDAGLRFVRVITVNSEEIAFANALSEFRSN
jgi:hypothetical protein